MTVVERKPVPIYQLTCTECQSVIQYKASEVHGCFITCPVCGMSVWADKITPVRMESPLDILKESWDISPTLPLEDTADERIP